MDTSFLSPGPITWAQLIALALFLIALGKGADWIIGRPDGSTTLDVRIVLQTDDDALIAMTYLGVRHGPQAVLDRMIASRDVANMVLFVASDLARNVTGQELVVDGFIQALN